MFRQRGIFKIIASIFVMCFIVAPSIFWIESKPAIAKENQDLQGPDSGIVEIAKKPHRIFAPHWITEGGLQTTIYIRNVHIQDAVTAKLSLILDNRSIT